MTMFLTNSNLVHHYCRGLGIVILILPFLLPCVNGFAINFHYQSPGGGLITRATTAKRNHRVPIELFLSRNLGALQELLLVQEEDNGHDDVLTDSHQLSEMNGTTNVATVAETCLVDFRNFWRKTQANFTLWNEQLPDRTPDFKSKGSGGSKYWDMGDYVIRYSNHWSGQHGIGRIVDCEWTIDLTHEKKQYVAGKCRYTDFKQGKLNDRERRKIYKLNKKKAGFQS